jgi:hypothetical protein
MWQFKPHMIKGTCVDVLMMMKLTWEKKSDSYHAKVDMTVRNTWELRMNKWTLKLESMRKTVWGRIFFLISWSMSTTNSLLSKSTAAVKIDMALTCCEDCLTRGKDLSDWILCVSEARAAHLTREAAE